jgi:hypothetical protein
LHTPNKKPYMLARLTMNQGETAARVARSLLLNGHSFKVAVHPSCYLITVFCLDDHEYHIAATNANKTVPEANIL